MINYGDEEFISQFMAGQRAYNNGLSLPESASDAYAVGWLAMFEQASFLYEEEQRDTARSLYNAG